MACLGHHPAEQSERWLLLVCVKCEAVIMTKLHTGNGSQCERNRFLAVGHTFEKERMQEDEHIRAVDGLTTERGKGIPLGLPVGWCHSELASVIGPAESKRLSHVLPCRSDKTRMRRKKVRIQNEQMKAMMSSLMTHKGEGAANSIDQLVHAHELAFVMTDMEGSTAQAAANPAAYAKIQQVHDMVRSLYLSCGHCCSCCCKHTRYKPCSNCLTRMLAAYEIAAQRQHCT